jgi:hypothetical protein
VNTCDGLNTILDKFDTIICDVKESVDILTEEITDITEDLMIITEDIININNQLNICCPTCDFTGTADQLPDPTTTTTSSSSTSTSTTTSSSSTTSTTSSTTTVPPTSTTTSTSSSTSTSTSSTTTSTTTSVPTTTTTTSQVYTYAGEIINNTGNTITANTAFIRVNGGIVAAVTLNIPPGGTQTFSTSYSPGSSVIGAGNDFTLELYTYTGVTISNDMTQTGGTCGTTTGDFANMGTYLSATSTTTGPISCSVLVIRMTIT